MLYGKRSHNKKVHQITASDEEPGDVTHENFDQPDIDFWSVDGSSRCVMGEPCQKIRWKQ